MNVCYDFIFCLTAMDVSFKTPANFYICGQTQRGKSYMVHRMLNHLEELFHPVPSKIVYSYGEYQEQFDEFHPNVELIQRFPNDVNELSKGHDDSLIVLDDLMCQCSNDLRVADLFTRGSHHQGISVLYLTHNLFPPGKLSISLNSHYRLIFRNPHNSLGITTLAKQTFPKRTEYLMEAFRDATGKTYGYLLIDCHQLTPENLHLFIYLTIFYEDALSSKMIFIRVLRINTVNILHMIKV